MHIGIDNWPEAAVCIAGILAFAFIMRHGP